MSKKDKRAELIRQATTAFETAVNLAFDEGEAPIGTVDEVEAYNAVCVKQRAAEDEFRRLMDELLKAST